MNTQMLSRTKHIRDDRSLCERVSINYHDETFSDVHTYLVSIVPNMTRANHLHRKKEESIALTAGVVELTTLDIRTRNKERIILDTKTKEYSIVHIPSYIAHSQNNIGRCDESGFVFSKTPEDVSDTIPFEVDV